MNFMYLFRLRLVLGRDLENKRAGDGLERFAGYRNQLRFWYKAKLFLSSSLVSSGCQEEGSPELSLLHHSC